MTTFASRLEYPLVPFRASLPVEAVVSMSPYLSASASILTVNLAISWFCSQHQLSDATFVVEVEPPVELDAKVALPLRSDSEIPFINDPGLLLEALPEDSSKA